MCAYLVSGEFRVHRDGCRDCEKEARRSDSSGHPEEYASRAEAIASLEAETIFLPGTSPAAAGSRPGELAAWAAGLGLEAGDLDDLVHDAYSRQASEVNNGGLDSQVLAETYGTRHARSLLSDLRPAAARRASAPGAAATAAGAEQRPRPAPGQ